MNRLLLFLVLGFLSSILLAEEPLLFKEDFKISWPDPDTVKLSYILPSGPMDLARKKELRWLIKSDQLSLPITSWVSIENQSGKIWTHKETQTRSGNFRVLFQSDDWDDGKTLFSASPTFKDITSLHFYIKAPSHLKSVYMAMYLKNRIIYGKTVQLRSLISPHIIISSLIGTRLSKVTTDLSGVDTVSPNITNLLIDGKAVLDGDFVEDRFTFTADVSDIETGVSTWNMVVVDARTGDVIENEIDDSETLLTGETELSYTLSSSLSAGSYQVEVEVLDGGGNLQTLSSETFAVVDGLQVKGLLNGPNPFNPNNEVTNIQYQLSEDADVSLYIYSISGEKLWESQVASGATGGTAGFNTVAWDGINQFGEVVANGPYILYVEVDNGETTKRGKRKILVLK